MAAVAAPPPRPHPRTATVAARRSSSTQPHPSPAPVAAPLASAATTPINQGLPPLPEEAEAALARLEATPGVVATAVVHAESGTLARVGGDVSGGKRKLSGCSPCPAHTLSQPFSQSPQPDTAARAVVAAAPLATLANRLVTADDPDDGLACLRVRSGRCELMVATGKTEKKEKKKKKKLTRHTGLFSLHPRLAHTLFTQATASCW